MGISEFRRFLNEELNLFREKKLEFITLESRIKKGLGIPAIMDKDFKKGLIKGVYSNYNWHRGIGASEFTVLNFKLKHKIDSEIDDITGLLNNDALFRKCWNFYRNYQSSLVRVASVNSARPKIESASLHKKLKTYIDEKIRNRP